MGLWYKTRLIFCGLDLCAVLADALPKSPTGKPVNMQRQNNVQSVSGHRQASYER